MNELTQQDREYLFFTDPELINKICRHVANGGSVIDIAALSKIQYCDIMRWIKQDLPRKKQYDEALEERKEWAKEKVLREMRELSYFDIRKILAEDGSVLAPKDWPDEVAKAVVGMDVADLFEGKGQEKIQTGVMKKIKFVDKVRAIEMQAKNLKLLTEQVEHTGKVTLDDLIMSTQKSKGE